MPRFRGPNGHRPWARIRCPWSGAANLGSTFELIARNRLEGDTSGHSATPAISNGQLFLRSARTLYCISH